MRTVCVIQEKSQLIIEAIICEQTWRRYSHPGDEFVTLNCSDKADCYGTQVRQWNTFYSPEYSEKIMSAANHSKAPDRSEMFTLMKCINQTVAWHQYLQTVPDDEVVELIDMDLLYCRPFPVKYRTIGYNDVFCESIYEPWHMHTSVDGEDDPEEVSNRWVLEQFDPSLPIGQNDEGVYQPIIGKAHTLRSLIHEMVNIIPKFVNTPNLDSRLLWWTSMFCLPLAANRLNLKLTPIVQTRIPCTEYTKSKIGYGATDKDFRAYHYSIPTGAKNFQKWKIVEYLLNGYTPTDEHVEAIPENSIPEDDVYFHEFMRRFFANTEALIPISKLIAKHCPDEYDHDPVFWSQRKIA